MILKVGVLASGNGTNLQAIIDKSRNGQIPVRVAVVISDRNAFALRRARAHNIPAYIVKPGEYDSQREYEQQMVDILKKHGSELVVLSGFMKILSPHFIDSFKGRIINIHPSLIPAFCGKGFYGMKVHEAVIDYGVKITGATVHFVDENVDSGPIIIQKAVAVEDSDTPETIAQKVHEIEHEILPEALKLFAQGKLKVIGRRVFIER
ncbi:phosphoribosylglycinamide formyltransferase [Pseudothermotoga lettingae]|uniref:Phosphoribosylglycinamide formyltransferase n=1 Tax=Pseudothermotoga lettingae (strain ATCC BAA-301 / DSM 14385 / NBRC 107922 / TMO) TaxID=416591 RepID=A8F8I0_PSELT|nr:phosphoribosylglycinamide formyltransferase [Pseudothermotoga lettingae]ABV34464.1 phosphoribosylglycinamide formyltransferase [Pseudothermotoga lettingae TMO]GLI48589.1 phosphoribosylglycinamide formyltransferase [Pseudothermotoga lettingae TMO]